MNQLKAIKLRVYPTIEQQEQLPQMFGNSRFVFNYMLNLQRFVYRHKRADSKGHLSRFDMNYLMPKLKRKYPWLKQSDSTALLEACNHVDIAYQRFFQHIGGFPRFKKRSYYESYTALCVSNNIRHRDGNQLRLPKLGWVRTQPITIKGTIKNATISVTPRGHYFVSVLIEQDVRPNPKTENVIGVDLGLRNLINLSNGVKYKSLKFAEIDRQIKLWQRKYARRVINAKRQVQIDNQYQSKFGQFDFDEQYRNLPWFERRGVVAARKRIAKLYDKKANYRKDYLQKLSTRLINQYDVIVFEDLKIKNMVKNHHLARAIGEQGWAMLVSMCEYKAQWYGKTVIKVKPNNTTQTCSDCGYLCRGDEHLDLGVKHWVCPDCGVIHNRDKNAANNILNAGLATL